MDQVYPGVVIETFTNNGPSNMYAFGTYNDIFVEMHLITDGDGERESQISTYLTNYLNVSAPIANLDVSFTISGVHVHKLLVFPDYVDMMPMLDIISTRNSYNSVSKRNIAIKLIDEVRRMHQAGIIHTNLNVISVRVVIREDDKEEIWISRFNHAFSKGNPWPPTADIVLAAALDNYPLLSPLQDIWAVGNIIARLKGIPYDYAHPAYSDEDKVANPDYFPSSLNAISLNGF